MKNKTLTAAASLLVLTMSLATAHANSECTEGCEPTEVPKGNNGWGNGTDAAPDGSGGTNNGSFTGGTAGTKSVNGTGVDKFDGKFEGR